MDTWLKNVVARLCRTARVCTCAQHQCNVTENIWKKQPHNLLPALEANYLPCLTKEAIPMIIDELVQMERDATIGTYTLNFMDTVLCDKIKTDETYHPLLVSLLSSKHTEVLYETMCLVWRLSRGDNTITSLGLKFIQQPFQASLVRLLEHDVERIVLSAIALIVTFLHSHDAVYTMTYIKEDIMVPLRRLLVLYPSPKGEKAHNLIGWLGTTSHEAVVWIEDQGIVKDFLHLTRKNPEAGMLMGMSRFVSTRQSRNLFVQEGGHEMLLQQLEYPQNITAPTVYLFRKLCSDPDRRRLFRQLQMKAKLLACYEHISTVGDDDVKLKWGVAFALGWLHLDNLDMHKDVESCIRDTLSKADPAYNLNIFYKSLSEHTTLLHSSHPLLQECGLWWLLHLLTCQANGTYKRVWYDELIVDEGLVGRIHWLMKQGQPHAMTILWHLCRSSYRVRQALIDHGVLYDVIQMLTKGDKPLLLCIATRLIENGNRWTSSTVPTLKLLCEFKLVDTITEDNVLLELAEQMRLYWLQLACLKTISRTADRPKGLEWMSVSECTGFDCVD